MGRKRIPGNSTRVRTKTEIKFLNAAATNGVAVTQISAGQSIILATDPTVNSMFGAPNFINPTTGTGASQVIGNKWIWKMIDLRFVVAPNLDSPTVSDMYRIMVVSERMATSDINLNLYVDYNVNGFARGINTPINTRFWKIHLDKQVGFTTGYVPQTINKLLANEVMQIAHNWGPYKPPQPYKFIIPFRHQANNLVANWTPERRMYVLIASAGLTTTVVSNMNTRLYFIDP